MVTIRFKNFIRRISMLTCLTLIVCLILGTRDVSAAKKEYGYLYFYTIDSEEIEKLETKMLVGRTFTFPDPEKYKYLGYEDGEGNILFNEHNDEVHGIEWVEINKDGEPTSRTYKAGDVVQIKEGEMRFRVVSDNPTLTGENLISASSRDHVFLNFYTQNGEEIESLSKEIFKTDIYEFKDPDDYRDSDGPLNGKGIYWSITDEDDNKYLVNKGDKKTFEPGYYDIKVITDDPVTVNFYYPESADGEDLLQNANTNESVYSGSLYKSFEAKVGDTITLYKSLGTLAMDYRVFKGWWEEHEGTEDDDSARLYNGGGTYKIFDNDGYGLGFHAVYEEDEDAFDPFERDANGNEHGNVSESKIFVNVDDINEAVAHGYEAYIDSTGRVTRNNAAVQINEDVVIKGTPGKIKERKDFTSLKEGGDKNNPEDYELDKYGNPIEESPLKDDLQINDVLRQDDSAYYMDIIGNSMIYYNKLTPEHRIELAYRRYSSAQTESYANILKSWDANKIERFIAINFALLKGSYPAEGEDLIECVADEYKGSDSIIWKSEYLNEKAYRKLVQLKKIWTGWLDEYSDGLYEEYLAKEGKGSSGGSKVKSVALGH